MPTRTGTSAITITDITDGIDGLPGADGADGANGLPGADGVRGAGRFDKSIATAAPLVGSTQYNTDARGAITDALGAGVNPVAGDTVVITYTDATRGAIHDGTGVADNDWTTFALQIDGSLLVAGTVVADSLTIGNSGGFYVDSNGNMTLRQITLIEPPAFINIGKYEVGQAVTHLGTEFICVNRDGCNAADLDAGTPGLGEILNGWSLFGDAAPAVTAFILPFDPAKTDYATEELVASGGNLYACIGVSGCNGTTEVPGVHANWETLVGGDSLSTSSRMVIDSNSIKIFEGTTNVITLGDLT